MKPGSAILPPEVIAALAHLSGAAAKLAIGIASFANGKGSAWPSRTTLMARAGLNSTATFAKACAELQTAGIIVRNRRGPKASCYRWATHSGSRPVQKVNRCDGATGSESEPVEPDRFRNQTGPVHKSNQSGSESEPVHDEHDQDKNTEEPKPSAAARRQEAAGRLVKAYGVQVKPPSLDTSRSQAKRNAVSLLKLGTADEATLLRCVQRYALSCQRLGRGPQYAKNAGNFFGREAVYEDFLADDWQPPSPAAEGNGRRHFTNPLPQTPNKYDGIARKVFPRNA